MKKLIIILILMCLAVINALWGKVTPLSAATIDTFLWGSGAGVYSNGDFTDAEKSGTAADNLLCWAAAAANVLAWGGWDGGVGNEDAVFGEFKDYWTNDGSWSRFGWEWWFTGNVGNAISPDVAWNTLGLSGSQFDNTKGTLDSADDFSPHFTLQQYQDNVRTWEIFGTNPDLSDADNQIFGFIDDGYGTALQLIRVDSQGTQLGAHAVTLWGYRATDGLLDGIYISDSDNNEGTAINNYSYYSVFEYAPFSRWHISNYGNQNEFIYFGSMAGLLPNSNGTSDPGGNPGGVIPEPGTILLLGFGLLVTAGISRKKFTIL